MQEYISLDEEVRDGFLVSSKRKKIWNVELDLLFKFDEVCKKYGLKYYLDSGTLLGAVRHKGFIPWDDDIDIVMMREDYDKLIALGCSAFTGDYALQLIPYEPVYTNVYATLRYKKSTAISEFNLFNEMDQGIFIDIFPMDGIPEDPAQRTALFKENAALIKAIKTYYHYDHIMSLNPKIIMVLRKRRKILKTSIKNTTDYLATFNKIEDNFRKCLPSVSSRIGNLVFGLPINREFHVDKSWYGEPVFLEFEGYKFPCPCEPHKVLDVMVGPDHMTPIQGCGYHDSLYFDPDRPYTDYLSVLRSEYTLIRRIGRALFNKFTGKQYRSKLEQELIKL